MPQAAPRSLAQGGQAPAAPHALPYRRVQLACSDPQFVAALSAYRASGGLATAEEVLNAFTRRGGHELATLARWIVARQVVSFGWQARTWLPLFQFSSVDMTPRRDLAPVLAALTATHDDWETAQWFVTPNTWLAGRMPVSALHTDLPAVLQAACAAHPAWHGTA
ncbi:MAG: hypothetical protein AD742_14685 [Methylibium sp. NZG]|nr:MAG: hypothetical protein AD742_14685 [Methylibium sp. NZG]